MAQLELQKLEEFVFTCRNLLQTEHPELFALKAENEWMNFIKDKLTLAKNHDIHESRNQFVLILTLASFPDLFTNVLPEWAIKILTWPGRSEDDKIILLCKEIYIRNQSLIN